MNREQRRRQAALERKPGSKWSKPMKAPSRQRVTVNKTNNRRKVIK